MRGVCLGAALAQLSPAPPAPPATSPGAEQGAPLPFNYLQPALWVFLNKLGRGRRDDTVLFSLGEKTLLGSGWGGWAARGLRAEQAALVLGV